MAAWLPIIYFGGLRSIPEYFERRFDRRTRLLVLVLLMIYLEGYIGINLLTIGVAMHGIFGWPVLGSAIAVNDVWKLYRPAPTGRPIFGRFRRCSSVTYLRVCSLVAPGNRLKYGPPNFPYYFVTGPKMVLC